MAGLYDPVLKVLGLSSVLGVDRWTSDNLGSGARRALARSLYPTLARGGFGPGQVYNLLRGAGLSYRKQDVLSDYRSTAGLIKNEKPFRNLPDDVQPGRNVIVETDLRQDRRYRVYAEVTYYDPEADIYDTQIKSMYTNQLQTKDQYAQAFDQFLVQRAYPTELDMEGVEIIGIEHNRGLNY